LKIYIITVHLGIAFHWIGYERVYEIGGNLISLNKIYMYLLLLVLLNFYLMLLRDLDLLIIFNLLLLLFLSIIISSHVLHVRLFLKYFCFFSIDTHNTFCRRKLNSELFGHFSQPFFLKDNRIDERSSFLERNNRIFTNVAILII